MQLGYGQSALHRVILPEKVSYPEFRELHRRPLPFWRPALEEIRERHALPRGAWSRAPLGRNVVFSLARELIVKLVPPIWRDQAEREAAALAFVQGRLPLRTPTLIATGELAGWRYLVFTFLEGKALDRNWRNLALDERLGVARQTGEIAAQIHALELPGEVHTALRFDWSALVAEELAESADGFAEAGLAPDLIDSFPGYVEQAGDLAASPHVLLHGDISAINLIVEGTGAAMRVTGLIDFGDARLGPFDHEFISPVMHFFQGESEVLEELYQGYGLAARDRTEALERRLMARAGLKYAVLLERYRQHLPGRLPTTWPDLARGFWRMAPRNEAITSSE